MPTNLKNLSYESNEPSFLRKLRAENTGVASDHQERSVARIKPSKEAADDDGPTYVLEGSNDTLSKAEYEALTNGQANENKGAESNLQKSAGEGAETGDENVQADEKDGRVSKQQTTGIGKSHKKRKLGKVVGTEEMQEEPSKKKKDQKLKKKTKAVKLSFGDDEAG
ncbi:hypothetical protein EV356DRAFT_516701 [Viridothelium virens]|uniref:DUF4604 domain-containing protein n=1 Tax=Viridothelium virens TaxID=1048519 RepID=A0A6A6HLV3_VIRVR|nr:hypothetical protein EV356DRAFT_516701 [Viridothelium virens]